MAQEKQMALALLFLGLYRGLYTFVVKKVTDPYGGPLWIFQAWLYAYFPQIKPIYDIPLRDEEDRAPCCCYTEFLLSYTPEAEDASFGRYFRFFGDPLSQPIFTQFANLEYSSSRLKTLFEDSEGNPKEKQQFWASILTLRHIPIGFSVSTNWFANCSFENYSPSQFARQFVMVQGIPVPFMHPTITEPAFLRLTIKRNPDIIIKPIVDDYLRRIKAFEFIPFQTVNSCITAFIH